MIKKLLAAVAAVITGAVLVSCSAASSSPTPVAPSASVSKAVVSPSASAAPVGTVSEQSAQQAAQGYLDSGIGFSRASLTAQLDSAYGNGFSKADATWAVNNLNADWNAQAVVAAKGYMSMGGFSRASLIAQLTSAYGNQFTHAQAVYAAHAVGL